jgi:S1-C subfamily serine protease
MARKLKFAVAIFAVFGILFAGYGLVGAKKYNPRGPWIGVYAQQIDDDLKEAFELDRSDGVLISEVIDGSTAK